MILRGRLSGVSVRVLVGCTMAIGAIVAGGLAMPWRALADNTLFWDDVTAAVVQTNDEPGVTWKSWYQPNCHAMAAIVEDYGLRGERDVCVVSSEHAQLAVFEQSPGGGATYALKRDDDEVFHRITMLTPNPSYLTLLPDDSVLGAAQDGADLLALYQLEQFHEKTVSTQIQTGYTTYNTVYSIDMSQRQLIKDNQSHTFATGSIAVSKNSKYAVVQALGRGLVWIDLSTLKVKIVTNDVNNGQGILLAVSNDGNSVAVTGNASTQQRIYTGIGGCGDGDVTVALKNRKMCHSIDFSNETVANQSFGTPYGPEFTSNAELVIHEWRENEQKSVKHILKPDPDSYRLEYLAMGDSYSSGEGDVGRTAGGSKYYLAGTDSGNDSCHISSRSYPFLLRDYLGISSSNGMRSVACSGAQVIPDMYGNASNYPGQGRRLIDDNNRSVTQQNALKSFKPGYLPQLEFVKRYQPKLVTLTGGGNDVGFSDILTYCAVPEWYDLVPVISDCQYVNENSDLAKQLTDTIDTQYYYNKKLISNMQAASPTSKIVLIGYPSFVANEVLISCQLNSGALTIAEIRSINKMVSRMNDMLRRVAHDTNISFIDIKDALYGGRICEGGRYMTGAWKKIIEEAVKSEQFHPNAEGHKRMAKAIEDAGISLPADTVPSAGDYMPSMSTKETKKTTMVQDNSSIKVLGMTIKIDPGLLKTLSQFTITVHSTPTQLGQFTTGADGSVDMTLPLDNVGIGRHVLALNGTSEEGNPIELFQFVEVKASATDADGDGIPDDQDPCQYITSWYDEETGEDVCAPSTQSPLAYSVAAGKTNGAAVRTASQAERHDYASATHDDAKIATIAKPLLATISRAELKTTVQDNFVGVILGAAGVILLGVVGWVYVKRKSKE